MYIVGIDIGKNHHEASIVSPEGKQIGPSLRFATTHKGADSLMSFIFKNIGNSPCVFGMEATGHYWYPIYSFLKAKGYTIYVINPIQSDSLRKMYIRQTKNDSIDSFLIAEVIRFGQFTTTSGIPHTCFFLAWGLTFILVPTRIIINHRIILTVRIQIQSVPAVHILLHKPSNHWVIKPCPQIILPAGLVILLSRVEDSVGEFFPAVLEHAKRIVLVPVFYLTAASRDIGSAVLLIQMIVVVTALFPVPAC